MGFGSFIVGTLLGVGIGYYIFKRRSNRQGGLLENLGNALTSDPTTGSKTPPGSYQYYNTFDPFGSLDDEQSTNYPNFNRTTSALTRIL